MLRWCMVCSLLIVSNGACRRSQTMRNDAGDPIMCVSPFETHPCTVGEYEDGLRMDIDGCADRRMVQAHLTAPRVPLASPMHRA
jgi:hypothetical protein